MEAAALPLETRVEQHENKRILAIDDLEKMSPWAATQYLDKYAWKDENGEPIEVWPDTAYRVVRNVLGALGYTDHDYEFQKLVELITQRKFLPGGRFLANAGLKFHQTNNCFLYRCPDSIDGWDETVGKAIKATSKGGGVGVVYSDVRASGQVVHKTGNTATGPLTPMKMVNEVAREIKEGSRRAALWAGLHWNHPDVLRFIHIKDWPEAIKKAKEEDFNFPAPMDMTNISVILDSEFFFAYENPEHPQHDWAHKVYWEATASMVTTGEPGFSIDVGEKSKENLRNPCCEITSEDDSDVCCLGSINLSRIESKEELAEVTNLGTLFLIAGTVYSDVPHEKVKETRDKNRRIGLGLMGIHEWLLVRGYKYEISDELHGWLDIWAKESDFSAEEHAKKHHLSVPIGRRGIAPNGTIGILGETTTSAELIQAVAYKRRFLGSDEVWKYQYVIDPTAARLIESGVDPDTIEDAHSLSYNIEKRLKFQAELQAYVDQAISSTLNLPYPITDEQEMKDFGETLMQYLPRMRGVTCYPDGSRPGQPFVPVPYHVAQGQEGVTMEENRDEQCQNGVCGV